MSSTQSPAKVLAKAFLLLSFAAFALSARSQVKPGPQLDRASLITTAREIMKKARYCALITLDSAGRPEARTMDPFPPDEQMIVWLATNPRSRKVAEIRRRHQVTLYYFDREDQAYVTISGLARIVNDPNEKAKHWKDEWKDFYADRNQSYLLIAVTPVRMEVVNQKQGIIGNSVTWAPPAVTFRSRTWK
jgi:general stress protein 26